MARIYVLDDSFSACMAIDCMLRDRGHEVVQERLGKGALANVIQVAPDLMICDLVLPDADGLEVCTFVKTSRELAHVPVVVISGSTDSGLRRRVEAAGGDALLRKPFSGEDLVRLVEALLVRRPSGAGAELGEIENVLAPLVSLPAVDFTGVADRTGQLLVHRVRRSSGIIPTPGSIAAVVAAAESFGSSVRLGAATSFTIELESGVALVRRVDHEHCLVLVLVDPISLGMARYLATRIARPLADALEQRHPVPANALAANAPVGAALGSSAPNPSTLSRAQHAR